ncbi:cytochrome b5-like [Venturia canescens]|uniref:cytochrome b5-like n=1 Tax=Venturia canescens TaxID=32260 RepID=UPI001C9CF183|nr:cytochrome b5-like [Venturia canescens]
MEKSYTGLQVSKHNKEIDLWMTMDGTVYNLTEFLAQHPGGEEVLLKLAGQDGTACFNEVGHSSEAKQLRESFRIGTLDGEPYIAPEKEVKTGGGIDDDDWAYEPAKKENSFVPVFIMIGAIIYAYIFLRVL